LGGCLAGSSEPVGAALGIGVAPLSLPGIADACYHLIVTNQAGGAGEVVWDRKQICASQYGDGRSSVSYIGTCDASPDGRVNSVTLEIEALYAKGSGGKIDKLVVPDDYVNPCPGGEGRCILDVPCAENADTAVTFNVTVLRSANQGFFDIAVNFEDIFCSSKIDCAYDDKGDKPIELLFDSKGNRQQTAVVALACTRGPGEDQGTVLHMNGPRVVCGEGPSAMRVEASLATTCVDTGEVFGLGATFTDGDVADVFPMVNEPDGAGGYTAAILPVDGAFPGANGGGILGRIDDDHVAGIVFGSNFAGDGVTGEIAVVIWARSGGAWTLGSVVNVGVRTFSFGDGFFYEAGRSRLWVGLRDASGTVKALVVPVSPTFELGTPWEQVGPPGSSCRTIGITGEFMSVLCDDPDAVPDSFDNRYVVQVYRASDLVEVTPPGLGLVKSANILCDDRLVTTTYENGVDVIRQWTQGVDGWTNSVLASNKAVTQAYEETMWVAADDGELSFWACSAGGAWQQAAKPETGAYYDPRHARLGSRAMAGIVTPAGQTSKVFIASLDLQDAAHWHAEILPMPPQCDGLTLSIEGVAHRLGRNPQLVVRCGGNGDEETDLVLWEIAEVNGIVTAVDWHYARAYAHDLVGILTRQGYDDGIAVARDGLPNCDALIGSTRAGQQDVAMATWSLDGAATGTFIPTRLLPMGSNGEGSSGGAAGAWQLDIDPTFEGNLWSPPHDGEPVFQVGSYHGTESLDCGGEPCNKVYWNVAVGFDPSASNCRLEWEATAAPAPGLPGGQTDKNTVYPVLSGSVQLTSDEAKGPVEMVCRQNPLNGKGSGVQTEYTSVGKPHAFCFGYDGSAMSSVEGCTWATSESGNASPEPGPPAK
jgi:hypothetical protein